MIFQTPALLGGCFVLAEPSASVTAGSFNKVVLEKIMSHWVRPQNTTRASVFIFTLDIVASFFFFRLAAVTSGHAFPRPVLAQCPNGDRVYSYVMLTELTRVTVKEKKKGVEPAASSVRFLPIQDSCLLI